MADKVNLRRSLLQQRQSLTVEVWQEKSQKICENLSNFSLYQQAKTILTYISFRQEPDLQYLVTLAIKSDHEKKWGLPCCQAELLTWHEWHIDDLLIKNHYGILEPIIETPTISPEQVDLILVPAIACDRDKYRLGYGGGFYDRLFTLPAWQKQPRIGIIFDFAYIDHVPKDEWDMPLSAICTERGIFE
ncbi:MAG: 5-formyltetrahydrofolate cyclo-ligase [Microcoleaceae cyanobacterium]